MNPLQNAPIWLAYGRAWCVEPEQGFEKALQAWEKSTASEEYPTLEDFSQLAETPAQSGHLFFQLPLQERVLLLQIQSGSATYAQAAWMLDLHPNEVGPKLWAARFALLQLHTKDVAPYLFRPRFGKNCPEFDPQNPWMQRLFDDEMGRADRVRIQNHSMSCESCRLLMEQMRRIYYLCAQWVPEVRRSIEAFTLQMMHSQHGKNFLRERFLNIQDRKTAKEARTQHWESRLGKWARWLAVLAGLLLVLYATVQMRT